MHLGEKFKFKNFKTTLMRYDSLFNTPILHAWEGNHQSYIKHLLDLINFYNKYDMMKYDNEKNIP